MNLAIMQPYFFPHIAYFQLIAAVDIFVVYTDVQFIKNGWINRNRILLNNAASWITLPVERGNLHDNINQRAFISYEQSCRKILNQLDAAYRKAPHFDETRCLIQSILRTAETNVATTLARHLELVSHHLGLNTKFLDSADVYRQNVNLRGQQRVIDICRTLNASNYYNSIGGIALYAPEEFAKSEIVLRFLHPRPQTYRQYDHPFISGLSIIDALMFNGAPQVASMLTQFDLVQKIVT